MTKNHPNTEPDYLPAAGRDAFLPFYDLFTGLLGAAAVHRTLISQAALADGQRVLEIGCGTGNLSVRLKRANPAVEVVGSDPDPRALAIAQRKARNLDGIRFERGYSQKLPYADGSFDRVLSALMLHHLDQDTKIATAGEVARVLRPGGRLHLVDFTGEAHGAHGFLSRNMMKSGHLGDNAGDAVPKLFGAAGLDCERVATRRHPVLGAVGYYRAVRPV
ncbi:class I SAM-dependent methyltransferase [Kutzneria sp. CA-103260]|uniref:class I SAM-dependent methyltransferase n=1 Tax=Kutzneria sp. CA-103260 TaxID=2802641 RepID=UPI001BADFC75|nr:class I SAM-dependent methyltransferase [Kutzneria sp. CA-103260]